MACRSRSKALSSSKRLLAPTYGLQRPSPSRPASSRRRAPENASRAISDRRSDFSSAHTWRAARCGTPPSVSRCERRDRPSTRADGRAASSAASRPSPCAGSSEQPHPHGTDEDGARSDVIAKVQGACASSNLLDLGRRRFRGGAKGNTVDRAMSRSKAFARSTATPFDAAAGPPSMEDACSCVSLRERPTKGSSKGQTRAGRKGVCSSRSWTARTGLTRRRAPTSRTACPTAGVGYR